MVRLTIILSLQSSYRVLMMLPTQPQSAIPAFVMGTLCIVGGVTGYARTRSIPSIVAGIGYVLPWYLR
jgi:hypothetical protein